MTPRPDLSSLVVGLSSHNEPTLGGVVLIDAAVQASWVVGMTGETGTAVSVQLLDCFGMAVSGPRVLWLMALHAAQPMLSDASLAATAGDIRPVAGGVWMAVTTASGALGLDVTPFGGRLALLLPNGRLAVSGAL